MHFWRKHHQNRNRHHQVEKNNDDGKDLVWHVFRTNVKNMAIKGIIESLTPPTLLIFLHALYLVHGSLEGVTSAVRQRSTAHGVVSDQRKLNWGFKEINNFEIN